MIIGTRGSDLAKFQAQYVAGVLSSKLGRKVELTIIRTQGDLVTDRPLRELEGWVISPGRLRRRCWRDP